MSTPSAGRRVCQCRPTQRASACARSGSRSRRRTDDEFLDLVRRVCADRSLWGADLTSLPGFVELVAEHLTRICANGVLCSARRSTHGVGDAHMTPATTDYNDRTAARRARRAGHHDRRSRRRGSARARAGGGRSRLRRNHLSHAARRGSDSANRRRGARPFRRRRDRADSRRKSTPRATPGRSSSWRRASTAASSSIACRWDFPCIPASRRRRKSRPRSRWISRRSSSFPPSRWAASAT